jgi:hypothetical protein
MPGLPWNLRELGQPRSSRIAVILILAWIDTDERLALMDEFIVRHVERNDEPETCGAMVIACPSV